MAESSSHSAASDPPPAPRSSTLPPGSPSEYPWPPPGVRHPGAAMVTLLLTTLCLGLSIGILIPLIAGRLESRGVDPLTNGLTSAVMYLFIGAGALVAGRAVRRLGPRTTFLAGAVGLGLAALGFAAVPHLAAWFAFRAVAGFGAGLFFVSTEVAVGLVGNPQRRARNLAFYGVAFSVGFSGGAALWPLLVAQGDWTAFGAAAAVCALALLVGPFLFPDVRPPVRTRPERRRRPRARLFGPITTGFSYGFCEAVVTALLPVYGARVGFDQPTVGLLLILIVGSGFVSHVPVGIAADRVGPVRLTRAAALVGLVGVAMALAYPAFEILLVTCVLAGVGVGSLYTLGLTDVGQRVDAEGLPSANAKFTAAYGAGSILGPALGGLIMIAIGPRGFFAALTASLAGLVLVSFLGRRVDPPSTHPPPAVRFARWAPELQAEVDDWT